MASGSYWQAITRARLSRRRALTDAGGLVTTAAALSLVGCGGEGDSKAASKDKKLSIEWIWGALPALLVPRPAWLGD